MTANPTYGVRARIGKLRGGRSARRAVDQTGMIRIIHDDQSNITILHEEGWDGLITLTWETVAAEYTATAGKRVATAHECAVDAPELVDGRLRLLDGELPPIDVITRAVALVVAQYMRYRAARALELPSENRGAA